MLNMTKLEALGIQTEEGLAYCADDPEFYEEMLMDFVSEAESRADDLQRFFACGDWANYRIAVHSLKNTAKMVGALALSAQALAMEQAAKELHADEIIACHDSLMADVHTLTGGILEAGRETP